MLSRPSSLVRPPPTPSRPPAVSREHRLWAGSLPVPRRTGTEEGLSSSYDNLLDVPRPLRRRVLRHPLQVPRCLPWPSPLLVGARLPLVPGHPGKMTTLQASLYAADRPVAPLRFDAGLSTDAGSFATGDLGVSPDRAFTGRLPQACARSPHVIGISPSDRGARATGHTPALFLLVGVTGLALATSMMERRGRSQHFINRGTAITP